MPRRRDDRRSRGADRCGALGHARHRRPRARGRPRARRAIRAQPAHVARARGNGHGAIARAPGPLPGVRPTRSPSGSPRSRSMLARGLPLRCRRAWTPAAATTPTRARRDTLHGCPRRRSRGARRLPARHGGARHRRPGARPRLERVRPAPRARTARARTTAQAARRSLIGTRVRGRDDRRVPRPGDARRDSTTCARPSTSARSTGPRGAVARGLPTGSSRRERLHGAGAGAMRLVLLALLAALAPRRGRPTPRPPAWPPSAPRPSRASSARRRSARAPPAAPPAHGGEPC